MWHAPLRAQCRMQCFYIVPLRCCVQRAPQKKERGFLRGLECFALTPLKLLSLVTLFRNTKESNTPAAAEKCFNKNLIKALPRQWQNQYRLRYKNKFEKILQADKLKTQGEA